MRPIETLDRSAGRSAFGADPANYHAARPRYPEAAWTVLRQRANLRHGVDILEIGPGTGIATSELLVHQPRRVVAVEPDRRLADFLKRNSGQAPLEVLAQPFEQVDLAGSTFDLAISATAFHWLDAVPALLKIRDLLRSDGVVALMWNVFGSETRSDPFHEATQHLFADKKASISSAGATRREHALDSAARLKDFATAGFHADKPYFVEWSLALRPAKLRRLYATFSNVSVLPEPERERVLAELEAIAARQFGGEVIRNMTTAIYTARQDR
ncbi:class I SAM-dependent methyltransferase [Devosia sediminis]|uniref:Class I SAM-dependent methyltransferase n=1 Tax=Devosia sediminis TaxID=2798801 RepID=A0A934MSH8_9HYPH|nr:class I SAM-dependent methyltransferase [Devosia sediminis]MBJ3786469.1 class I SAM-dependent methyltransferase [Devosia sediminis]